MSCMYAFFFLTRYILITKPTLREEDADITKLLKQYKKSKLIVILFPIVVILVIATYLFIDDNRDLKPLSTFWILIIPISQLLQKRMANMKK